MKGNNGKDAYWFSHDSNAKDDPKCMLLIDQLGLEGYGIYWVLVEILREQPDFSYPLALIPAIAKRYGTSVPKVEAVISGFGLFEIRDDKFFYSTSLITRVLAFKEKQDAKTAAAIKANMIRWKREKERKMLIDTQQDNPTGIRSESDRNPNLSQEKKIKENKRILESKDSCQIPSEPDVQKQDGCLISFEEEHKLSALTPNEMVDIWNAECGSLPRARKLSDKRVQKAKLRIKEFGQTRDEQVEIMKEITRRLSASNFANGRTGGSWRADFGWVIENSDNWVKVLEGRYDNVKIDNGKYSNDKWDR